MSETRHKVHVYAIVRVEFWAEGAESPQEAARQVLKSEATHKRLHELQGDDFEYAEDWGDKVVVDTYVGNELVEDVDLDISNIDPSAEEEP